MQALEVQPTAREVVHHVLVFALPKGARIGGESMGFFAAYVPGNNTLVYPDGYAKKLPQGLDAAVPDSLHAQRQGHDRPDEARRRVREGDSRGTKSRWRRLPTSMFQIPPGADNHKVVGSDPGAVRLPTSLAFFPHAHLRGKAAQYESEVARRQDRRSSRRAALRLQLAAAVSLRRRRSWSRAAARSSTPRGTTTATRTPPTPTPRRPCAGAADLRGDAPRLSGICGRRRKRETGGSTAGLLGQQPVTDVKLPKGGIVIPEQFKRSSSSSSTRITTASSTRKSSTRSRPSSRTPWRTTSAI